MQVCHIVILDLRCNIYMTCGLFLILHRVLCVLAIDPGTSTECTETPVCDEPGRYRSYPKVRRERVKSLPTYRTVATIQVVDDVQTISTHHTPSPPRPINV